MRKRQQNIATSNARFQNFSKRNLKPHIFTAKKLSTDSQKQQTNTCIFCDWEVGREMILIRLRYKLSQRKPEKGRFQKGDKVFQNKRFL